MSEFADWLIANWQVAVLVAIWIVVNVYPRPHPDELSGWRKTMWALADRLSVLTATAVPGKVKCLFARSPGREDCARAGLGSQDSRGDEP